MLIPEMKMHIPLGLYIINLISRNKNNDQLIKEITKVKEKSKKKLLKEQGINFV